MRYFIFPTCKESHRLVVEGQDRHLGPVERLGLRLHLSMCDACTNFSKQMEVMRRAMGQLGLRDFDAPEPITTPKDGK